MKGIIFFFFCTLLWDTVLHYEAWRHYSKILRGHEFNDDEMRRKMLGHTNSDIIEYAIGHKPTATMVNKYAKEKEEVYRNECLKRPDIFKLAPGSVELLDYLKYNNIPMAIATMSEWDNVKFYIEEFNLEKWFPINRIIYSNGKIPGKPAPDIFLLAAKSLNLHPNECVVVEDAIAGIEAAKRADIGKIIAIDSLEPTEYYSKISNIHKIINNFYEFDFKVFES